MNSYRSLNDATLYRDSFREGTTQVWYVKPEKGRLFRSGVEYLESLGEVPTSPEEMELSHIHLGSVFCRNIETLYSFMQAEVWSPNGEAVELIESKGLAHTSMSVGDIIVVDGQVAFMIDLSGVRRLW